MDLHWTSSKMVNSIFIRGVIKFSFVRFQSIAHQRLRMHIDWLPQRRGGQTDGRAKNTFLLKYIGHLNISITKIIVWALLGHARG